MGKKTFIKPLVSMMTQAVPAAALLGVAVLLFAGTLWAEEPAARTEKAKWSELKPLAARSILLDTELCGKDLVAVGERGHVLVSKDSGSTWKQIHVPTRSMLTALAVAEGGRLWAVGHDAVIMHSADGGESWTLQQFKPEELTPLFDVWFENASHGFAVGAYGLFYETQDGGKTWKKRFVDEEERHWYGITESPDGTLYVPGEFGAVFRSEDKGKTWQVLTTPYEGTFFGSLALKDGSLLIFGLRGNLFRSTDRGETWNTIKTGTTASLLGGVQMQNGTIVIAGLSGTLLISKDNAASFQLVNRPDRLGISTLLEVGPGQLLLFGEEGVKQARTDE